MTSDSVVEAVSAGDLRWFPPAHVQLVAAQGGRCARGSGYALNLAGIADWSTQHPFIDVMKSARPWVGHLPGQWGGWEHGDLAARGLLDPDGWPRAMPPELTGISTLVLTDQPGAHRSLAGRYRLTYRGQGRLELGGGARIVVNRPGEIWFEYAPGGESVILTIQKTDPRGAGEHLRDIEIVHERLIAEHDAGHTFNPRWIERLPALEAVRFMDWMATNGSRLAKWEDRPRPGDYTYGLNGVPVEVMVELANLVGADPWFTLPHLADDTYVRAFAEYVRTTLRRDLRAYVEYSNELWNWQFEQAHWAKEQAEARWGSSAPGDAWLQFAGGRAAEMADIWTEVFGQEAAARLVRVIATQTAWMGLEKPLLEAPLWVAEAQRRLAPAARFDAYAVTGYFGSELGADEKAPMVIDWLETAAGSDGSPEAVDLAVRELFDGSISGSPSDTIAYLLGTLLPYHASVADAHGLDLVAYEGGTHVAGIGEWSHHEELARFFAELNYSAPMAKLYHRLLDGWESVGGGVFAAFSDVGMPSRWGSWGHLRHLDDTNPRWDAFRDRADASAAGCR